jgi:hypothetical protein
MTGEMLWWMGSSSMQGRGGLGQAGLRGLVATRRHAAGLQPFSKLSSLWMPGRVGQAGGVGF